MKYRAHTCIYLVIMTCYLVSPVMPFIEYSINKDYIAKYLCINRAVPGNRCHGKCHLHKQLEKFAESNTADQDNNRNDNQTNKTNLNSDQITVSNTFSKPDEKITALFCFYDLTSPEDHPDQVFKPPKTS